MAVAYPPPPSVTETDEPSPWRKCVAASGAMGVAFATAGQVAATSTLRDRLWRAAGAPAEGGLFNYVTTHARRAPNLQDAVATLLGWVPARFAGTWADLVRLPANQGVALGIMYSRLPAHYTRWDRRFAAKPYSGHEVFVTQVGGGWAWIQDPLARGSSWRGERIRWSDLRAAVQAFAVRPNALVFTYGSHAATHWVVSCTFRLVPGPVFFYALRGKVWDRVSRRSGGFTYRCSAPAFVEGVMGSRRRMVILTSGQHKGELLDVDGNSRLNARLVRGA